jgi:hypothetical protein
MALLPNVFTPEDAEDMAFNTLSAGWYNAEIVKSSINDTKNKDGKYISFQFKILDDDNGEKSEGRFVFTNLNIVNKNEMAVKLAYSDLKKICAACNFQGELEDTTDLHNIPMMIKLSVKPETTVWPAKNEIKDYKPEGYEE